MEFRLIGKSDFDATLKKWMEEAEAGDLFPNEVEKRLNWIKETFAKNSDQSHTLLPYGIFQPGSEIALATCELVLSDKGSLTGRWLKMLKVTLSPEIELAVQAEDMEATNIAVNAYKAAVLGSFAERLTHDADTLKLYGRSDEMLRFLMVLLAAITQDKPNNLSAKKDGRWLVIKSLEQEK